MVETEQKENDMTQAATITRNKIIGDAFAEYEINRNSTRHLCTAEQFVNETLREHGLPPMDETDTELVFNHARHAAIQKACAELTDHVEPIACSRHEYVDEALREIGQPGITEHELRQFDIRA